MNRFKKVYCRAFQTAFKLALPFLPYRQPEVLQSLSEIPALFPRGVFELAAWRAYAQARFGSGASLFSLLNPA